MMRSQSPSVVPELPDETVHMVLDDLGKHGRVWRELDFEQTSERNIIEAILGEQFNRPVQVVAFNLSEGWSRDVSEDIARDVAALARQQGTMLGPSAKALYEWATGEDVPADVVEP
jgi:hypothetical protein